MTTNRPRQPKAPAPDSSRRVVAAGGVTIDWSRARTGALASESTGRNAEDRVATSSGPGGAVLLSRLTAEVGVALADTGMSVDVSGLPAPSPSVDPGDPRFHHSYATWAQFPRRARERGHAAWRVEGFLGVERARLAEPPAVEPVDALGLGQAELVILDDANLGFRDRPKLWPTAFGDGCGRGRFAGPTTSSARGAK